MATRRKTRRRGRGLGATVNPTRFGMIAERRVGGAEAAADLAEKRAANGNCYNAVNSAIGASEMAGEAEAYADVAGRPEINLRANKAIVKAHAALGTCLKHLPTGVQGLLMRRRRRKRR